MSLRTGSMVGRLRALGLAAVLLGALPAAAQATSPFPVTEGFTGASVPSPPWYSGGSATLTGTSSTPGWLRLTSAANNQFGYTTNDTAFPSGSGILVGFDYASFGGTGADGLTFFLYNGTTAHTGFATGPSGGSLGYASCPANSQAGLTNAYVGVGFDEYGNFANRGFCGQDGYAAGLQPNRVTIRDSAANAYKYLTSVPVASGETLIGASEAASRRVVISVTKSAKLSVYITYPDGTLQTVTSGYQLPSTPFSTLKFGWVASTGGFTDSHEIRNVSVTEPTDLQTRLVSGPATAGRSSSVTYTFSVTNNGEIDTTANAITGTLLSGALQNASWTCSSASGTCGAASGSGLPSTTADLPAGASATYTITGQPAASSDYLKLQLEADPTGPFGQAVPADNIAQARTDLAPVGSGATPPGMTLANTNGYTGRATGTQGTYLGGDVIVTDNWQHCGPDGSGCADITGATALTYATGAADRGYTLRLHEHASNGAGSTDQYTAYYTPLPNTHLTTATPAYTNSTSASFTLSSTTSGVAYECKLDGGAWASCSATPSYSSLGAGAHTLNTRSVYAGLSDPLGASYSWTVDTTAPTDTSTCGSPTGANGWYDTALTCTVSATDSASLDHVEYYVDSGSAQSGASGAAVSIPDGTHALHTRAQDSAGNYSAWRTFALKVDAPAPADTSACGSPNGQSGWFTSDPTCTVQGTDAISGVDHVAYQLDSGIVTTTASGTPIASVPITSDGSHTLKTEVFNVAGGNSGWSTQTIQVDTDTPGVSITDQPASLSNSADASFSFSTDEAGTVQCQLDGGTPASCSSPQPETGLLDGRHTFKVLLTDPAGNAGGATYSWTVDTMAPTDTSTCGSPTGANGWYDAALTCTVSATDAVSLDHVEYYVDSGTPQSGPTGTGVSIPDGVHTLHTRAQDTAGNYSAWQSITVNVDTTAPTDTSSCGSPTGQNGWFVGALTCTVSATDDVTVDHVEYYVDSGSPQSAPSGTDVAMPDGRHTLHTRAQDTAGNYSPWQSATVNVDTTTPTDTSTCRTPTGQNGWFITDPTCTVQGADAISGIDHVAYQLDSGPVTTTPSGTTTTAVPVSGDGTHTLRTQVFTVAGGASGWATQTIRIATTPPAITFTSVPAAHSPDTSGTIAFAASEPATSFACRLDAGTWAPCTSPFPYSDLPEGQHTFAVRGTDPAGNVNGPVAYTWTIAIPVPPPPPSPGHVSSTGTGTDAQDVQLSVPPGDTVTLQTPSGIPTDSVTVPGQGTYELDPGTGTLTFVPALGFSGTPAPVVYQLTDGWGRSATATYTPAVRMPAPPAAPHLVSSGPAGQTQSRTVALRSGTTITLLAAGRSVSKISVTGGTYVLGSGSGLIKFLPAAHFHGRAKAASYRVTDAYRQSRVGTYTATVTGHGVTVSGPAVAVRPLVVLPASGRTTVPVRCSLSIGQLTGCTVALEATNAGRQVVIGTGHARAASPARSITVPVTLNALGLTLADRVGGIPASAAGTIATAVQSLAAQAPTKLVASLVQIPGAIRFRTDSDALTSGARAVLRRLRGQLGGARAIGCTGYSETVYNTGDDANEAVYRARAVCQFLAQGLGIPVTLRTGKPDAAGDYDGPILMRGARVALRY